MASGTRLHSIDVVRGESVKARRDEASEKTRATKKEEVAAFLASVHLGSLARQPRPGDVFRQPRYARAPATRRPLGLIPDRGGPPNPYTGFLPPIFPAATLLTSAFARSHLEEDLYGNAAPAGQAREHRRGDGGVTEDERGAYASKAYRHHPASGTEKVSRHLPSAASHPGNAEEEDTLAECKTRDNNEVGMVPQHNVTVPLHRQQRTKTVPQTGTKLLHNLDFRCE